MTLGKVSGRQLVTRPLIVPSSFDRLQPDRFDQFYLFFEDDNDNFRFKLTVVDRTVLPTNNLSYATAVFLIPAGREAEYIFSSKRGLASVAESAHCARLIAVSFGRHHVFESQEMVQQELTFVVQTISRQGSFLPSYKKLDNMQDIPFMAIDGLGKRNVLAEGHSEISGKYLVEEVESEGRHLRRLYFMNNPSLIQTEVVLKEQDNGTFVVDPSQVAFDYHKAIVAGLLALVGKLEDGLLIGLGGGGFVNLLHYVAPRCKVTAVELDPSVAEVAEQHFGLDQPSLKDIYSLKIGDGLEINVPSAATDEQTCIPAESLSFIVIDVDAKDMSVGMSCPPVSFLDTSYLNRLKSMLLATGALAVNVSARDPTLFEFACSNLGEVFDNVYLCKQNSNEDINVVVIAIQSGDEPSQSISGMLEGVDSMVSDELNLIARSLSRWTQNESSQQSGKTKSKKKKGPRKGGKKR